MVSATLLLGTFLGVVLAQITVGNIGDSITQGGCGCGAPDCQTTYSAQLQSLLGPSFNVTNFGVSGMTMLTNGRCGSVQMQDSNCSWVGTWAYPAALAAKCDIYTIFLGTNDAKNYNFHGVQDNWGPDSYALDYFVLINQLRRVSPSAKIFAVVPIPLYVDGQYGMNGTVINSFYPQIIPRIAAAANLAGVIDLHAYWTQHADSSYTCDGVHPVAKGNTLIATAMAQTILEQSESY